jgi:hypothetical protein
MLKEFAWKTFEKTGNIESYLFYRDFTTLDKLNADNESINEEVAIASDSGA